MTEVGREDRRIREKSEKKERSGRRERTAKKREKSGDERKGEEWGFMKEEEEGRRKK